MTFVPIQKLINLQLGLGIFAGLILLGSTAAAQAPQSSSAPAGVRLVPKLTAGDPNTPPVAPPTPAATPLPSQGQVGDATYRRLPGDEGFYEVTSPNQSAPVLVDENFLRKQVSNPSSAGLADKILGGYPANMGRMTDDMLNTNFPAPGGSADSTAGLKFPATHGGMTAKADPLVPGYIRLEGTDAEGNPVARTIPAALYNKAVEAGGSEALLVERLLKIPMQVPESIRGRAQQMSREEFLAAILTESPLAKHPAVRVAVANHTLSTVDTTAILKLRNREGVTTPVTVASPAPTEAPSGAAPSLRRPAGRAVSEPITPLDLTPPAASDVGRYAWAALLVLGFTMAALVALNRRGKS